MAPLGSGKKEVALSFCGASRLNERSSPASLGGWALARMRYTKIASEIPLRQSARAWGQWMRYQIGGDHQRSVGRLLYSYSFSNSLELPGPALHRSGEPALKHGAHTYARARRLKGTARVRVTRAPRATRRAYVVRGHATCMRRTWAPVGAGDRSALRPTPVLGPRWPPTRGRTRSALRRQPA